MKIDELKEIDVTLNVEQPQNKIVGYIEDLENTSLVVKTGLVVSDSEEDCVCSGEFYKYIKKENGMYYFDKCTTQGEKPDVYVQATPTLLNYFVKVDTGNIVNVVSADKNATINFVDCDCNAFPRMEVVEAVNYNDWLQLAENGNGLEKLTTGYPVCRAKETTTGAGIVKVGFGIPYVTATTNNANSATNESNNEVNNGWF